MSKEIKMYGEMDGKRIGVLIQNDSPIYQWDKPYLAVTKSGFERFDTLVEAEDQIIEEIWIDLEDIPVNPDTEEIEVDYYIWKVGTDRNEIWGWFNKHHSKGINYLMNELER